MGTRIALIDKGTLLPSLSLRSSRADPFSISTWRTLRGHENGWDNRTRGLTQELVALRAPVVPGGSFLDEPSEHKRAPGISEPSWDSGLLFSEVLLLLGSGFNYNPVRWFNFLPKLRLKWPWDGAGGEEVGELCPSSPIVSSKL